MLDFLAVGAFDGDFCAARFETQERAHAEKCIASDFFSAFDGFEQEGVGLAFGYSEEGGDRGQQIGGDRLHDGDERRIARKAEKLFVVGADHFYFAAVL